MKAKAFRSRRAAFVSAIMLSSAAMPAFAQDTPDEETKQDAEIVVTGYRASLESSANAKRDSIGFTDSVFAEDIGKFPDTNIAESLNRIPGVTITREISGDGLNVAIRGLGTNFTRVLLNNAPIAIASTGRTDSQNTNREVDLDLCTDVRAARRTWPGAPPLPEERLAEERCEDVREAAEVRIHRRKPTAAQAGVAEPVVGLPALGIRQHLVRLGNGAESELGVGLLADIGMELAR